MYYPFMRGKRHELSSLRKLAGILDINKIRPIIEPVKINTNELLRTIIKLNEFGHCPLVIINPIEGEVSDNNLIYSTFKSSSVSFIPCIAFCHANFQVANNLALQFIGDGVQFASYFKDEPTTNVNAILLNSLVNAVRVNANSSVSFINQTPNLVKIQDSFQTKERNADFPTQPYIYSDILSLYKNQPNCAGFGDFQIVGELFSSSGGPARAVALHITYFNSNYNNYMFIKHCVSTIDSGTTSNTAGKFIEALNALISFSLTNPEIDQTTLGFQEFISLHKRQHFPNLGPAKESSMMHHIETIVNNI